MSFEGRKGGPGKKKEAKKTTIRRDDLDDAGKKLYDEEKAADLELWKKEAAERVDAKLKKILGESAVEKTDAEKKFEELLNIHKQKALESKIKELEEKLNPPSDPDHIKEYKAAKKRLEMDDILRQTEILNKELAKRMNPPKDDPLDAEYKAQMEKMGKLDKIYRNEQLAKQIKQKIELIEDKKKYLGGSSGGGWFSGLFSTNKSKNLTGGGLMAFGLILGMVSIVGLLPMILGGGILLSESDESKAKKASK